MWPTREYLEGAADTAYELAAHIKRYWPVDGKEPSMRFGSGPVTADGLQQLSHLMSAVVAQREGSHPGPVIEWQLRLLACEWFDLHVCELVGDAFGHGYIPPPSWLDLSPIPFDLWSEWSSAVPEALRAVAIAAEKLLHAMGKGPVVGFSGGDLESLAQAVRQLRDAIAFVPTEMQVMILGALDHESATGPELMTMLDCGSKETLYGKKRRGGLSELVDRGIVKKLPGNRGYYRPDRPPTQKAY